MAENNYTSRWEIFLSLFIEQDNVFTKEAKCFQDELKNMQLLHSCFGLRQTLIQWLESLEEPRKSQSVQLREKGNKILKDEGSYFLAINYYTKAIYAAQNCIEASLAHANRAYVLLQKLYFHEAYEDCECALNLGYPKGKEIKVILRQAECAIFLDNPENLKKCIGKLKTITTTKANSLKISEKLTQLKTKLIDLSVSVNIDVKSSIAEKKQILCSSLKKGTYVVAGEKILKDEEIMCENAFAFVPLYDSKDIDHVDLNCQHCAKTNIIPFPCKTCRAASYCSIKCRDLHEIVHRIECWGCKKQLYRDIGIAHLALRALVVGYSEMLLSLDKHSDGSQYSCQKLWKGIVDLSRDSNMAYAHVIRLSSNLKLMNTEDFLRYALTASMLVCYLRSFTNFFETTTCLANIKLSDLDWEVVTSALLLRHIGQMVCNAHSITGMKQLDCLNDLWKSEDLPNRGALHMLQPSKLFAAIYPRVSLYNHCCEPNFYNKFNETILIVKAARDLKIKEEIFNCYGINFKRMSKVNRKAALKSQYSFDCDCKHCENGDKGFKRYHTYLCINRNCKKEFTLDGDYYWWKEQKGTFKLKCPFCGTNIDWQWYQPFEALSYILPELGTTKIKWFSTLCDSYHQSKLFLTDFHELKQEMARTILSLFIDLPYDRSRNEIMIDISIDLLNAVEDQCGSFSLDFVFASTYFLDLLAIGLSNGDKVNVYYVEKILYSFQILSDKEKKVFENYIDMYIQSE